MKGIFKKAADRVKTMFVKAVSKVDSILTRVKAVFALTKLAFAGCRGEGFVDSGVKILIAVVIGALLLAGLYTLFGDTILPTLSDKIKDLFNYNG